MNFSCGPMFAGGRGGALIHVLVALFVALVGLLIGWACGNGREAK
jgi:hypothetical protein